MLTRMLFAMTLLVSSWQPLRGETSEPPDTEENSEQKTPATQNGGINKLFVINVVPADSTQEKVEPDNKDREEKTILDRRLVKLTGDLAIYTRWLFMATGGLALVTGGLVAVGIFQACDARKATGIARRNLELVPEIERAYVSGGGCRYVEVTVQPGVYGGVAERRTPTNSFEVHINNHGKTPARVHHFRFCFCDAAAPLPQDPPYGGPMILRDAIGPGVQGRRVKMVEIPQGQFARIAICGRFYWRDIWDREWSSGFIYEIAPGLPNDSISIEAPEAYWNDQREE
jgi:hypothetical protein